MELVFIILFVIVVLALLKIKGNCTICGVKIKRKSYKWAIGEEAHKVCPSCNAAMERKQSSRAIKRKFG